MNKIILRPLFTALITSLVLTACSDSDSVGSGPSETVNADLIIGTRVDDSIGFMVAVDAQKNTAVTNDNGVEITPSTGIFVRNKSIYTTGSTYNDKLVKYSFDGLKFTKEAEVTTGEQTLPTSFLFVNDSKSYVSLATTGELIVVDPSDLSISKRIDLSSYALGEGDINPEPSGGVIRDGKLYLALAQIDSFQTWRCQAGASVLIIDVETDIVEKHIQDDRTCLSGDLEPSNGLFLDEVGDIYVVNTASFGYHPDLGLASGYLRINNGSEEFDPSYFFALSDLDLDVPGGKTAYPYRATYNADGKVYANLMIPGLTSSPPNYAEDKNYLPYRLDLRNQTATKLDMPATVGWSASILNYNDTILFGMQTDNGTGLFLYDPSSGTNIGDQTPYIATADSPVFMATY